MLTLEPPEFPGIRCETKYWFTPRVNEPVGATSFDGGGALAGDPVSDDDDDPGLLEGADDPLSVEGADDPLSSDDVDAGADETDEAGDAGVETADVVVEPVDPLEQAVRASVAAARTGRSRRRCEGLLGTDATDTSWGPRDAGGCGPEHGDVSLRIGRNR